MASKKNVSKGTTKKVQHVNLIFRNNSKISSVFTFSSEDKEEYDSDYDEDGSYTTVSSNEEPRDQDISEQDLMLYLLHQASIAAAEASIADETPKERRFQNHNIRKKSKVTNEKTIQTPANEVLTQKNADELVEEEEREKRKAERKKEKKKRRREKKREKENIELSDNNTEKNNYEEIKQEPTEQMKQNFTMVNNSTKKKLSTVQTNYSEKKIQSVTETNNNSEEKRNASEVKDCLNKKRKSPKTNESLAVEDDDELLDPYSAFVSVAVSKNKKIQGSYNSLTEHFKTNKKSEQNNLLAKSEKLALLGFDLASKERYEEAIDYFTEAIQLVQDDPRFYGNRSFCYCQLGHFTKALKDADRAISLTPQNPKNHYRRGAALRGLKDYKRAQQSFEVVLQLDEGCEDAQQELEILMVQQLTDMGFHEHEALTAIKKHHNVQVAVEELTSIENNTTKINDSNINNNILDEIYYSDEESETETACCIQPQKSEYIKNTRTENFEILRKSEIRHISEHTKMTRKSVTPNFTAPRFCKPDVVNPEGFLTLWVGNVSQETTEKQLSDLFCMYGSINYIKLLPEKYCAFVNYKDKMSSGMAMRALQGTELNGCRILIRYPTSHKSTQKAEEATTSSPVKTTAVSTMTVAPASMRPKNSQVKSSEEIEECHFWRTTGCLYGQKCRFRHVKENKGVDRKPWHRV